MQGQLVLVAGLPGCGKTTYLCQMCHDGWVVFDDFKALAFEDCSKFSSSRKLRSLLAALRDGLKCIVADIDFCDAHARADAESVLLLAIPELDLSWRFFANDRPACEANARSRSRQCLERELSLIAKYAPSYQIPRGAIVLPVRTDRQLATGNWQPS
jgi:hypothetical protein